jgi:hypothetical protein
MLMDDLWVCIFAYDHPIQTDDGEVILFASEDAAMAGGIAEWGEECRPYLSPQKCVLA